MDAVVVIGCFLAIVAFARKLIRVETRHWWALLILSLTIVGFAVVLVISGKEIGKSEGPRLRELEIQSTP